MSSFEWETFESEEEAETESVLEAEMETELATELLEISSEEELEDFLGKLFKGVAKSVGGIIKSPVGQALGGVLKNVAKKALPIAGAALGSVIAPGAGTAIGGQLGSMASNLFEVELEGMEAEEAEFEVARRYVRFAAEAAKNAALAPENVPPWSLANAAVADAARQYAPGLVMPTGPGGRQRGGSGRWYRRGRRIVVLGA
jgi:uncharacterized protein (DUF697 family)